MTSASTVFKKSHLLVEAFSHLNALQIIFIAVKVIGSLVLEKTVKGLLLYIAKVGNLTKHVTRTILTKLLFALLQEVYI